MKLKHWNPFRTALPAIIVIPAMTGLAAAAVIIPDGFGDVLVTASDSGANHIVISAGQPAGSHKVRFDPGAFLTPAGAPTIDIQVPDGAGASYTVNMGDGASIDAGANDGITTANTAGTAADLLVNATGTITGANGISGGPGLITAINDSVITGIAGDGITSTGVVALTNHFLQPSDTPGSVTGSVNGVTGGGGSVINNFGIITGSSANGFSVGANATVSNLTSFDMDFPFNGPIFGGHISGADNGVFAGDDLTLTNENLGRITGGNGGIETGNNADITNDLGAEITGNFGIFAGDDLTLSNGGTITGLHGDAILAGLRADITNTGTITAHLGDSINVRGDGVVTNSGSIISAGDDGIVSDGLPGSTFTLNNAGLIQGPDKSFAGGDADETLNLNLGSRLIGDVNGGLGADIINFGASLSSPGATGNSISGDINGFGNINKTDGGVALIGLPGEPLFSVNTDTIKITEGGLYINADIAGLSGPLATINSGGAALGGLGTWNADVNITGSGGISAGAIPINLDFTPANSIGQVTITGDVAHDPGTFIRFDVAPQRGGADLIRQTGVGNTYDVTGTHIRISSTNNNQVISNGTYTLVDSDEIITGVGTGGLGMQFNPNVNASDTSLRGSEIFHAPPVTTTVFTRFFTAVATADGGTNLVLFVNHDFANLPGLTPNAAAFGAALDASTDTSSDITQDFIAALDFSDLGTVQATFSSLIPDNILASASVLTSGNYRLHRTIQDHLAMTRSGGTTSVIPPSTNAKGGFIPAQLSSTGRGMGNVWGTFSHNWQNSDFGTAKIDGENSAFTAGVDYRVAPNFLIGFLLDGSQADLEYNGGGSEIDSFRAAIYGTYGEATGIYTEFLLGYGSHDLDLGRNLGGVLTGTSNVSTNADSVQALVTVGYAMRSGSLKHGPYAGFEYQNIDVNGFAPTGVAVVLGGVGGFEVDSFRLLVGYRAEARYGKFTHYGSITYAHEFENGPIDATATIPGGAAFRFTSSGVESAILISVGTGYAINENLGLNTGYHGEISTHNGVDSHGLSAGVIYSF